VGGSGYFDGASDYLTVPDNAAWDVGSSNFTIEGWFYPTGSPAQPILIGQWTSSYSWVMLLSNDSNRYIRGILYTGSAFSDYVSTAPLQLNAWNHCAFVRESNTVSLYLNGSRVLTNTFTGSVATSTSAVSLGANSSGADPYLGYMSSTRVVVGTALYSGTTYTVPTAPLTAVSGTQLLLNFTNAGVIDATAKNVLETEGNAQISTAQSKWGGGSIKFDGTGDAARIPDDEKENLRFGTGNFTIEFWAWKSANGSMDYDTVISIGSTGSYNGGFSVELSATRGFCFISDNAIRVQSNFNPNDSTWNHYAVVRDGSTFALYKNGSRLTTATLSTTLGITGTAYVGAGALTDNSFNGYIDDLRVTKGLARYTGTTYTTPTAPFPVQ
jgi:hypothetical protein